MPDDPAAAVVTDDVTVRFGDRLAICDVTFEVPAGAVAAIIGPNGSGKTTLLRTLSGLEQIDHGTVTVLGGRPGGRRAEVAHVMQTTEVNDAVPVTVREVVTMGRYARLGPVRRAGRDDRDLVDRALERMDITELAGRHLRELSGGQRQRVYVAQGLVQEASLLLLDEPMTGLDLVSQEAIEGAIREETAAGRTVVFTTHDVEAAAAADRVVLLATHVVATGPPEDVLTAEHLGRAYGGRTFQTETGMVVLGEPHQHGPGVVRHGVRDHEHEHDAPDGAA